MLLKPKVEGGTASKTDKGELTPQAPPDDREQTAGRESGVAGALSRFGDKLQAEIPDKLAGRVVILAGLLMLIVSWAQRQFGWTFGEWAGTIGIFAASYGFLAPVAHKLWTRHRNSIEKPIAEALLVALFFLLKTPVLIGIFLVSLIPTLFTSTVTVVAAGAEGPRGVQLYPSEPELHETWQSKVASSLFGWWSSDEEEAASTDGPDSRKGAEKRVLKHADSVARIPVFTSPFGRNFVLRVDGYKRRTYNVYPLIGQRIEVKELEAVHTVMMRLPPSLLKEGADNETSVLQLFHIEHEGTRGQLLFQQPALENHGSYVFGKLDKAIPDEAINAWSEDIAYLNKDRTEKVDLTTAKHAWLNVVQSKQGLEVRPGMLLECRYLSEVGGSELASLRFSVDYRPFQDRLLVNTGKGDEDHKPILVVLPLDVSNEAKGTVRILRYPEEVILGSQPLLAGHGGYVFARSMGATKRNSIQTEHAQALALDPARKRMARSRVTRGFGTILRNLDIQLVAELVTADGVRRRSEPVTFRSAGKPTLIVLPESDASIAGEESR